MNTAQIDKAKKFYQWKSALQPAKSLDDRDHQKQQTDATVLFIEEIIKCSSSAIATCDLDGNMTYGNPAFFRIWGFDDPEDHLGKPFWHFWFVEDRLDEIMKALQADGIWSDEIKARRKDGAIIDVQVSAAVVYDRNGNPVALTSTSIDISGRKRVEEALVESEQFLRLSINTAGLAIWDWDIPENTIRWLNPWQNLIGGQPGKENGYEWWAERIHPEDFEAVISAFKRVLTGDGESLVLEYRFRCADGTWLNVIDRSHIFRHESGKAYRIIGALLDVTSQSRTEEELRQSNTVLERRVKERTVELENHAVQLARLSSELTLAEQRERRRIAEIMHDDLQQLLVAARMHQELLLDGLDNLQRPQAERVLEIIDRSIQAARSLTTELSPTVLRSGDLSASLEWLAKWMAENHGFDLTVQTQAGIVLEQKDLTVLLFQSIRELLFNVVKHAGVKSARVEMGQERENWLRITVTDSGNGFDPKTIWEKAKKGTGFGLFSIRERLILLGGNLEIASSPGRGASFALVVPLEIAINKVGKTIIENM